ncbi:MAG TPA: DUF2231 domain-containing protein [Actinomycetota bacterium]|jgi:uncharacterized membrane protein|nr:DUF2231 domain-containing protein [Actinomycetota bacterium]
MAIRLKHRSATGEMRFWTFREIVQGKPIDRPTHPMFVHFPIAFSIGALGLDAFSRIGHHAAAPVAATWLIVAALAGFAIAMLTGLAERATMRSGSRIRSLANRHMLLQFAAAAVLVVDLAARWSDRSRNLASLPWIGLDLVAVLLVMAGADIGGTMVFKIGYRGLGGD